MYCSNSVFIHLLRGVGAAALIAWVLIFGAQHMLLAVLAVVGAVVLLRGCPMCWLMGLAETVARKRANRSKNLELK